MQEDGFFLKKWDKLAPKKREGAPIVWLACAVAGI